MRGEGEKSSEREYFIYNGLQLLPVNRACIGLELKAFELKVTEGLSSAY
jgi:hypothetical protein